MILKLRVKPILGDTTKLNKAEYVIVNVKGRKPWVTTFKKLSKDFTIVDARKLIGYHSRYLFEVQGKKRGRA